MLSHTHQHRSGKTGQISLLRSPLQAEGASCCPIRAKVVEQVATLPEHGPQAGKQPRETVRPVAARVQEAQQHVHQQRRPDLPLNGVPTVAEEVAEVVADAWSPGLGRRVALAVFRIDKAYAGLQFSLGSSRGPAVSTVSMPPIMATRPANCSSTGSTRRNSPPRRVMARSAVQASAAPASPF